MKYICSFIMLLSLIGSALFGAQAMAYVYVGQGLHPAIAAIGVAFLLACGYWAARQIDDR